MAKTNDEVLARFLKVTGFTEEEIQGYSAERKIFSTIYGQKFQMRGKDIRQLTGGGNYPNAVVTEKATTEDEEVAKE